MTKPRLLDLFCGGGGALFNAIPPAYTEWIGSQLILPRPGRSLTYDRVLTTPYARRRVRT